VERELAGLQLQLKLTNGPKKSALELIRKKIEMQNENVVLARTKHQAARKASCWHPTYTLIHPGILHTPWHPTDTLIHPGILHTPWHPTYTLIHPGGGGVHWLTKFLLHRLAIGSAGLVKRYLERLSRYLEM